MTRVIAVGAAAVLLAFALGTLLGARLGHDDAGATARGVIRPRDSAGPAAKVTPSAPGFIGVVFARRQVDLAAAVDARLTSVPVQLGQRLAQGEVVATLDAEGIRGQLAAATAAVRAAQAEVQSARVQAAETRARSARLEKLGDAVSAEELETARYQERLAAARVVAAQARVGEAMAHVEQVRQLLETTAVTAPFDGVVADRYKDPGAMVGPGQPIIRLISVDDLWVRFAVPEEDASTVQVRGCIRVAVSSLPVTASGTVENVAPQIDAASRMLMVEAKLALPAEWLGKLPAGVKAHVTAVPCQAQSP